MGANSQLIVVSSPQAVVAYPAENSVESRPPLTIEEESEPPLIFEEESEAPANNTRARKSIPRTIRQEALIAAMEVTSSNVTARNSASRKYPLQLLCELAGAVMDENGKLLQYRHLISRTPEMRATWMGALGKEVGRLAQGLPGVVEGTDTMCFIHKHEVPMERFKDVTYGQIVCNFRPEKDDPNRARVVVGGTELITQEQWVPQHVTCSPLNSSSTMSYQPQEPNSSQSISEISI